MSLASIDTPKPTKRILSYNEKMSIRAEIEAAKTEEEKAHIRVVLAGVFGVSVKTIGAIGAWTKIWGQKELERVSIDVPEKVKKTLEKPEDSHKKQPWEEDFMIEFASEFDLSDPRALQVFYGDIIDLFPGVTEDDIARFIEEKGLVQTKKTEEKTQVEAKVVVGSGEGFGALIDYDNPTKIKWRAKLAEFIANNTDTEKRATMKVLCLPGVECREIPMYLELGFRPENIVGVEAGMVNGKTDPKLLKKFEENAQKLGIQYRLGKLDKILKSEENVFDVVSLDFLGPLNESFLFMIANIGLAEESIVLLNFQARRENTIQRLMKVYGRFNGKEGKRLRGVDDFTSILMPSEHPEAFKNTELSDVRNSSPAYGAMTQGNICASRFEKNGGVGDFLLDRVNMIFTPERILQIEKVAGRNDRLFTSESERVYFLSSLVKQSTILSLSHFIEDMSKHIYPNDENMRHSFVAQFIFFCQRILFQVPLMKSHKMYSYTSETGTPMVTDCLRLELFRNIDFSEYKHLSSFVLKFSDAFMQTWISGKPATESGLRVAFSQPVKGIPNKRDSLQLFYQNRLVGEILIPVFIKNLDSFMRNKTITDKIDNSERESIS